MNSVSIVIPCFNESNRFPRLEMSLNKFDERWPYKWEAILVNDGSNDDTLDLMQKLRGKWVNAPTIRVIELPKNYGKGFALRSGVLEASYDHILTLDADMAADPIQLISWIEILEHNRFPVDKILVGSRKHPETVVRAKWQRRTLGGVFNLIMRLYLGLQIKDTQCGFKLYPAHIGKFLFHSLIEKGWVHDIEVLLRASKNGIPIMELPVTWSHIEGGKINVWAAGLGMLAALPRIKKKISDEEMLNIPPFRPSE